MPSKRANPYELFKDKGKRPRTEYLAHNAEDDSVGDKNDNNRDGNDYLAQDTTKQCADLHHFIEPPQDGIDRLPSTTPLINSAHGYTKRPTCKNDGDGDMVEITSSQFYEKVGPSKYGGMNALDHEPERTQFTNTQAPEEVIQKGCGLPFELASRSLPQQVAEFSDDDLARGFALADFVAKHPESQEAKDWGAIDLSGDAEFLGLFNCNGSQQLGAFDTPWINL